jgi:hypothetical protein
MSSSGNSGHLPYNSNKRQRIQAHPAFIYDPLDMLHSQAYEEVQPYEYQVNPSMVHTTDAQNEDVTQPSDFGDEATGNCYNT